MIENKNRHWHTDQPKDHHSQPFLQGLGKENVYLKLKLHIQGILSNLKIWDNNPKEYSEHDDDCAAEYRIRYGDEDGRELPEHPEQHVEYTREEEYTATGHL